MKQFFLEGTEEGAVVDVIYTISGEDSIIVPSWHSSKLLNALKTRGTEIINKHKKTKDLLSIAKKVEVLKKRRELKSLLL
jgi:hypothetical protein